MKIVQINVTCGSGSTGKICVGISKILNNNDIENYIIYASGKSDYSYGIKCAEFFPKLQALRSRVLGNYGFNSQGLTKKIINELDRIAPDIVHLHNLHSHNCNLELLMKYFCKNNIKVVWTFHDCWAFTAYCPHFAMFKCDKWKTGCNHCGQIKNFSWFWDRSEGMYKKKKDVLSNLDMTIVTPSLWLMNLVKESFLKEYPVKVINNGIDLEIFRPRLSECKKRYHIPDEKFIVLGVAIQWGKRKGLDVFIKLAELLDTNRFQIVLVGTDENVDKQLPQNIISIHRTQNQVELAEIYSVADLLVNPTREDTFPTVNIEAIACGTPVLTFRTGGSPEIIDVNSGIVVDCDDEEAVVKAILEVEKNRIFSREKCREHSVNFDEKKKFVEYVKLYREYMC